MCLSTQRAASSRGRECLSPSREVCRPPANQSEGLVSLVSDVGTIESVLESRRTRARTFELSILQSLDTRLDRSQNATETFQIDVQSLDAADRVQQRAPASRTNLKTNNSEFVLKRTSDLAYPGLAPHAACLLKVQSPKIYIKFSMKGHFLYLKRSRLRLDSLGAPMNLRLGNARSHPWPIQRY